MRAIHHIDGDPTNNDPSNIQIVETADHARHSRNTQDYAADLAQRHPLDMVTVNDLVALRRIIAEVIAAGWQCSSGCDLRHPWSFNSADADLNRSDNEFDCKQRQRFIAEIERRVIATAAPATGGGNKYTPPKQAILPERGDELFESFDNDGMGQGDEPY